MPTRGVETRGGSTSILEVVAMFSMAGFLPAAGTDGVSFAGLEEAGGSGSKAPSSVSGESLWTFVFFFAVP